MNWLTLKTEYIVEYSQLKLRRQLKLLIKKVKHSFLLEQLCIACNQVIKYHRDNRLDVRMTSLISQEIYNNNNNNFLGK